MKLCVFQGTFNPIHRGHTRMADYVLQHYGFDEILFIPAYKPPHKEYDITQAQDKFNMVKLVVDKNPHYGISDIEYRSEKTSYSYLTVCELYKQFDIDGKIKFIIGTDAFEKVESWYEVDKFKEMVDFIVFVRENERNLERFNHLKDKGYSFEFSSMDFVDISSTELRKRIQNNEPIKDLVTEEVEEYIKENGLYKS